MIELRPAECPHVAEYWDLRCHVWRCQLCGAIPFVADQIQDRPDDKPIGDVEPVDDEEFIRVPRVRR